MEKVLFAVVRVPDEAVPLGCVEILHAALERDDLLRFRPAGYRDLDLRCVDLLAFPDFGRCRVKNAVFIHISQHLLEIAAAAALAFFPFPLFVQPLGLFDLFSFSLSRCNPFCHLSIHFF